MKKKRILVSWMAALSLVAVTAQTVCVSPQPQRIVWGDKAFGQPKGVMLKGADDADADAVALLRSNFADSKKETSDGFAGGEGTGDSDRRREPDCAEIGEEDGELPF